MNTTEYIYHIVVGGVVTYIADDDPEDAPYDICGEDVNALDLTEETKMLRSFWPDPDKPVLVTDSRFDVTNGEIAGRHGLYRVRTFRAVWVGINEISREEHLRRVGK